MLKFAAYFDLFFKDEPYDLRAKHFSECGFKYAETWRGADLAELKLMNSNGIQLISVLISAGKDTEPPPTR